MKERIPVAILGSTGAVGQYLVKMLGDHKLFRIAELCASPARKGQSWREAVSSSPVLAHPVPEKFQKLQGENAFDEGDNAFGKGDNAYDEGGNVFDDLRMTTHESLESRLVFSAVPSRAALEIEMELAKKGHIVCSNASAFRMHPAVPLIIPEINSDHLALLAVQPWSGRIVTNPNCVVCGLALALAPLQKAFGLKKVSVTTMQSASGAGYPGIPSLALMDNVIPFISDEENKISAEVPRILGSISNKEMLIKPAELRMSVSCYRVPLRLGHLMDITVTSESDLCPDKAEDALNQFRPLNRSSMPSAPEKPIITINDPLRPQPLMDILNGQGMSITAGPLRQITPRSLNFTVLVHNLIRGAAGAAVLNAELLAASLPAGIWSDLKLEIPLIPPPISA